MSKGSSNSGLPMIKRSGPEIVMQDRALSLRTVSALRVPVLAQYAAELAIRSNPCRVHCHSAGDVCVAPEFEFPVIRNLRETVHRSSESTEAPRPIAY
jgi:hypothetical protein